MALTADEKAQLRTALGYPAPPMTDSAFESALSVLSDAATLTLVRAQLTDLASIDTQLAAARGRYKVSEADGVVIAGPAETRALRLDARQICASLAATLHVECRQGPYGGSSIQSGWVA